MRLLLPSGDYVYFDAADADLVLQYRWKMIRDDNRKYAIATHCANGGLLGSQVRMHSVLMGYPSPPKVVDHIDLNGLNNRRGNLRIATGSQNAQNRAPNPKASSRYKGVYRRGKKWRAQISCDYRKTNLGTFQTEPDAARAYDAAALTMFGPGARINFPHTPEHEHNDSSR